MGPSEEDYPPEGPMPNEVPVEDGNLGFRNIAERFVAMEGYQQDGDITLDPELENLFQALANNANISPRGRRLPQIEEEPSSSVIPFITTLGALPVLCVLG